MSGIHAGHDLVNQISNRLKHSSDLKCKRLELFTRFELYCIYLGSIVDDNKIEEWVIKPAIETNFLDGSTAQPPLDWIAKNVPFLGEKKITTLADCLEQILNGHCLLVSPEEEAALSYDVSKGPYRAVSEPQTEAVIQGPREGFIEDIDCNVALIRKRIRNEHLSFELLTIGAQTKTRLYLVYMGNIASSKIVDEFRSRLNAISTDSILESAYIEELIQDKSVTPFPQFISTERPDVTAAKLLEGQVVVMTDGTPFVLIGPITFFQLFTSPEDYYQRADIALLIRWLRMLAFLLAVFVPALYIAVISYHQEMLPTTLLISLAVQRVDVPFPAFIEAAIMMVTFEILREAGLRMPRISGQAISIVGALVLGQAAVEAGLVSTAMVIVVSLTAISNFISPNYRFGTTQRILQFYFMILAGIFGLFGIMCGVFFLLIHMVSIQSFGVPYMAPLAPPLLSDWKDTFVRVPRTLMKRLPAAFHPKRTKR
ncbi:spore germination protein [Paenibacillus sp. BC26]|uniref:spore germination protein n=1 Tax=Paenibacillus sp. BC26 TaxID=1881032 RepID=UPI0008F04238|nr:spore germination protein [Paenibacillus sp. BC26]SFS65178.1 spore germination protein KA [Paenibacillus sp. BC26]